MFQRPTLNFKQWQFERFGGINATPLLRVSRT
jgi:hypothetical protein